MDLNENSDCNGYLDWLFKIIDFCKKDYFRYVKRLTVQLLNVISVQNLNTMSYDQDQFNVLRKKNQNLTAHKEN